MVKYKSTVKYEFSYLPTWDHEIQWIENEVLKKNIYIYMCKHLPFTLNKWIAEKSALNALTVTGLDNALKSLTTFHFDKQYNLFVYNISF